VHQPPGHRVAGRPPGQRLHRERLRARRQHEIAEPPAAQYRGIGDQAGVREDRPRGGDLRPGVCQRRAVGHVGCDHALLCRAVHGTPGRGPELRRGEVGRGAPAREHVRDDHVERAWPDPLEFGPGVADTHPEPAVARRQPEPDQVHQRSVHLHRQLRRARPGGCHVAGQGERPGTQVQHAQRLPGRRGRVDHVPQPPDVLEVQVTGVLQVHVRLRHPVDQQHPRGAPVGVPEQLGPGGPEVRFPPSRHTAHYRPTISTATPPDAGQHRITPEPRFRGWRSSGAAWAGGVAFIRAGRAARGYAGLWSCPNAGKLGGFVTG
jgi:hypothetical protein